MVDGRWPKMDKISKIFIVGHGVIEKALTTKLRRDGFKNVFSSSEMGMNPTIQTSIYEFFQKHRPEYVFLGSTRSGGIEANQKYAAEFIYHNIESQNNVVYAAHKFGTKKLLYIAASCVYPKNCPQPMKEEHILTGPFEETSQAYSVAKLAGIELCRAYRKQYNFNAICMVPATIYGPESDTDLEKAHVMGALLAKFQDAVTNHKNEVTVWGTGTARREFLYVDDFVDACLFLMERYNEAGLVNIGVGKDVSIRELAEIIKKTVNFQGKINFDTLKPDGASRKLLDSSKILQMGWYPKVELEKGIERTYKWYKTLNSKS